MQKIEFLLSNAYISRRNRQFGIVSSKNSPILWNHEFTIEDTVYYYLTTFVHKINII